EDERAVARGKPKGKAMHDQRMLAVGLLVVSALVSVGCGRATGGINGSRIAPPSTAGTGRLPRGPGAAPVVSLTAPEINYPAHISNRLPDRIDSNGAPRRVKFVCVGLLDYVAKIKCIAARDQANLNESTHVLVGVDAGLAFSGLSVRWNDTA